ncbi:MAG: hypothetical protein U1E59_18350 [Amaricoccus sp.]
MRLRSFRGAPLALALLVHEGEDDLQVGGLLAELFDDRGLLLLAFTERLKHFGVAGLDRGGPVREAEDLGLRSVDPVVEVSVSEVSTTLLRHTCKSLMSRDLLFKADMPATIRITRLAICSSELKLSSQAGAQ